MIPWSPDRRCGPTAGRPEQGSTRVVVTVVIALVAVAALVGGALIVATRDDGDVAVDREAAVRAAVDA